MNKFFPFALVLLYASYTAGCNDNPFDLDELLPPALFVQVVDENNKPIPDVGFHYIFYVGEDVVVRHALLGFGLDAPDSVTLKIYDPFGNEKIAVYEKQLMQAGQHSYMYDGTTTTNGVYEYEYTTSKTSERITFFLLTDNVSELESMPPLIVSNHEGRLTVHNDALGMGQQFFSAWPPNAFIIGNSITVVLVKEGYQTFTEAITLDKNKASRHTFRMQKDM